jgi:hypothetical protein
LAVGVGGVDVVAGGFEVDVVDGGFEVDVVAVGFEVDVVDGGFEVDVVAVGFDVDVVDGDFAVVTVDVLPDVGAVDVVDVPDPTASVVGSPPAAACPPGATVTGGSAVSESGTTDTVAGGGRPIRWTASTTWPAAEVDGAPDPDTPLREPSPVERWTAASAEPVGPDALSALGPGPDDAATNTARTRTARPTMATVSRGPPRSCCGRRWLCRRSWRCGGSRSRGRCPGTLTSRYGTRRLRVEDAETVGGGVVVGLAVAVPDQPRRIALAEVPVFVQAEGVPMPAVLHPSGLQDENERRAILP